jgi:cytosine/adenosine deaminase-related metal-dependent hydrolase
MKKLFIALLLLALPVRPLPQPPQPLVFTHVTIIDATGAPAQPDMTVVIRGDRITELGKSGTVHAPQGAHVVDATAKFLIPGLWDMHVHWLHKDYLPLFIANGVTGIRIRRLRREPWSARAWRSPARSWTD